MDLYRTRLAEIPFHRHLVPRHHLHTPRHRRTQTLRDRLASQVEPDGAPRNVDREPFLLLLAFAAPCAHSRIPPNTLTSQYSSSASALPLDHFPGSRDSKLTERLRSLDRNYYTGYKIIGDEGDRHMLPCRHEKCTLLLRLLPDRDLRLFKTAVRWPAPLSVSLRFLQRPVDLATSSHRPRTLPPCTCAISIRLSCAGTSTARQKFFGRTSVQAGGQFDR